MKNWAGRLLKIGFIVGAIIAIMLTILFNMGGSTSTLKFAVEDYITQVSGLGANVEQLNRMTFFPNISVDAEGIRLKRIDAEAMKAWAEAEQAKPEEEQGKTMPPLIDFNAPDGSIGKFVLSMSFWDVSFGLGRSIKNIQVKNVYLKPGIVSHKAITIDVIEIDETPEGKPFLNAEGQLGDDAFNAIIDLEGVGTGSSRKHKIGEESNFEASIGSIAITGVLRPRSLGGFHARDVVITHNKNEVIHTTLSFVRDSDKKIELKGEFTLPENGSSGSIDWLLGSKAVEGTVEAKQLDFSDFNENSELVKLWTVWNQTFKNPEQAGEAEVSTLSVTAETVKDNAGEMPNWQGNLTIKNNDFNFQKTQ